MGEVDDVIWMVRGAWVSLCVRAACELRVVDVLDHPRTGTELAQAVTADPAALERLLRVLVDLDLVRRDGERYAVTTRGAVLRRGHPSGLRDLALVQTVAPNLTAWSHASDAVRQGRSVYEQLMGMTNWEWLEAHPDEETVFNAAMARRAALAAAGLGARAHGEPADFFDAVPAGGDLYVLSNVLHDWDDDRAVAILGAVRSTMGDGARLLVVETVLDAPGRSPEQQRDVHLVDLHMLVMFGARERTRAEYDALFTAAGLAASTTAPSPNTWNVLLTHPAGR